DAHHITGGDFISLWFDNKDTFKCHIYCRCTKEADDYASDDRHLVNPHPRGFFFEGNVSTPQTAVCQVAANPAASSRETTNPRTEEVELGVPSRSKSPNQAPKATAGLLFADPCIPDAARGFQSRNPHWIRLMTNRNVHDYAIVNFVKEVSAILPRGRGIITLYVAGQQHSKAWEVNCINEDAHFGGFQEVGTLLFVITVSR
ncbi:hypothetical protein CCACVL1_19793, partial [Corchorus capsularis]